MLESGKNTIENADINLISFFESFFMVSYIHSCSNFLFLEATDPWLKVNSRPVCFGAKNSQHGGFSVPYGGKMAAVKLVRLSGYVACSTGSIYYLSFWGCGTHTHLKNHFNVVVTTSSNHIILPLSQFFTWSGGKWYELPGYNSLSPDLVLPFYSSYSVTSGQQFHLWYGEDLVNWYESDNTGRVCCDVYALYE